MCQRKRNAAQCWHIHLETVGLPPTVHNLRYRLAHGKGHLGRGSGWHVGRRGWVIELVGRPAPIRGSYASSWQATTPRRKFGLTWELHVQPLGSWKASRATLFCAARRTVVSEIKSG